MLSDDDLNLRDLTDEELDRAWELWFDLAQTTNDDDPPYTHGVFCGMAVAGSEGVFPNSRDSEPRGTPR